MKKIELKYDDIRLRIICDEYIEYLIKKHFLNHINFEKTNKEATYTLIISGNISTVSGNYHKMFDKWFDNATLDCFIDNKNKICYATNFHASNEKYKNLLIQYFVANVFNRFLEINGYLGIHSSCVEMNRHGVLFVAGRNSGKTICMLNMMNAGFNIVTNDKIALKNINNELIGYGIAQSVSIRLSPQFCAQPENQKYIELAKSRGIKIKNKNMLEGNNLILSDNEVAIINNVRQVYDTPISCIVNPEYDPFVNKPIFDILSENQILELFSSQYMSLVHDTTSFLREINGDKDLETINNLTLKKITNIPCYHCRQNEKTREEFTNKVKKLIFK